MSRKTAEQVAEKYGRNASAAQTDYVQGVQNVTESPTAKAAGKLDKALINYTAAIQSGKTKAALLKITTEDWKKATIEKGGARYSSGVMAAVPKMKAFMTDFLPFLDNVGNTIKAMPDLTLDDNINRMVAHARAVSKFKKS